MANPEADRLSDEGMRFINERRWKEALDALDRAIALDPEKPNAKLRRAEAALGLAGGKTGANDVSSGPQGEAKQRDRQVRIVGLGVEPGRQVTLEALIAL